MDLDVVAKLQGQVGTLSAAARPESQEPITVDEVRIHTRSRQNRVPYLILKNTSIQTLNLVLFYYKIGYIR